MQAAPAEAAIGRADGTAFPLKANDQRRQRATLTVTPPLYVEGYGKKRRYLLYSTYTIAIDCTIIIVTDSRQRWSTG